MTLLELTVVILVLLSLAGILFTGARAWKRGSDRAICITNLGGVQKAVRGYANMSGLNPGDTETGLEARVVGPDRFFDRLPVCPGNGTYALGGDQIPEVGDLYMSCSLESTRGHVPERFTDW